MGKPRLYSVRNSPIHGRGVFARQRIRKGHEILHYAGQLRTHEEVDDEHGGEFDSGHTFLFTLNELFVVDGGRRGNAARWINHACQPNCQAFVIESDPKDPAKDRIVIEARRDIEPGEELTYDYKIPPEERVTRRLKALWACRCGTPRCRGTMLDLS